MRAYLKKMAEAPYTVMPEAAPKTVIAALGPKMLELAASETVGAHPYFLVARSHGDGERNHGPRCVALPRAESDFESDPAKARELAARRRHLSKPTQLSEQLAPDGVN